MWLLDSSTIELKEFASQDIPDYAILSHTWGEGEVSFQDMQGASEETYQTTGYEKIRRCCSQAASDGFDYVWIDTCCINKLSSSELSEAINSMYQWYSDAEVCYAYLVDVPSDEEPGSKRSAFARCRWFTRGWALQELLAPSTVIFFGQDWVDIGTKASLQTVISKVTGISPEVLLNGRVSRMSVGQRMSWASRRQTTRIEDTAYCLMGLFGVNMPLLYGEGEKAFLRLQLEIIKSSDDHTIFSWTATSTIEDYERGLLARRPAEFSNCGNVRQRVGTGGVSPYTMTNKGLCIELHLIRMYDHYETDGNRNFRNYAASRYYIPSVFQMREQGIYLAVLNCYYGDSSVQRSGPLGIYLKQKVGDSQPQDVSSVLNSYVRTYADIAENIETLTNGGMKRTEVYVKEPSYVSNHRRRKQVQCPISFYVMNVTMDGSGYALSKAYPETRWTGIGERMQLDVLSPRRESGGALMFKNTREDGFLVLLSIDFQSTLHCDIVTSIWSGIDLEEVAHRRSTDDDWSMTDTYDSVRCDRVQAWLPGGYVVFVALRPGCVSGNRTTLIDITIRKEIKLEIQR
ncbi:hypothetical protein MMC18_005140 [Xylographa bjoerkii]|nr:hypothetical protein [Xylographa bjoerkii]